MDDLKTLHSQFVGSCAMPARKAQGSRPSLTPTSSSAPSSGKEQGPPGEWDTPSPSDQGVPLDRQWSGGPASTERRMDTGMKLPPNSVALAVRRRLRKKRKGPKKPQWTPRGRSRSPRRSSRSPRRRSTSSPVASSPRVSHPCRPPGMPPMKPCGHPAMRKLSPPKEEPRSRTRSPKVSDGLDPAKQRLGEELYPLVLELQPEMAGKITGMILEMDDSLLIKMTKSETLLRQHVNKAVQALHGIATPPSAERGRSRSVRSPSDSRSPNRPRVVLRSRSEMVTEDLQSRLRRLEITQDARREPGASGSTSRRARSEQMGQHRSQAREAPRPSMAPERQPRQPKSRATPRPSVAPERLRRAPCGPKPPPTPPRRWVLQAQRNAESLQRAYETVGKHQCMGCGSTSHQKADCPQKLLPCARCHRVGHAATVCWRTTTKEGEHLVAPQPSGGEVVPNPLPPPMAVPQPSSSARFRGQLLERTAHLLAHKALGE